MYDNDAYSVTAPQYDGGGPHTLWDEVFTIGTNITKRNAPTTARPVNLFALEPDAVRSETVTRKPAKTTANQRTKSAVAAAAR
jgi:hypothetical protein